MLHKPSTKAMKHPCPALPCACRTIVRAAVCSIVICTAVAAQNPYERHALIRGDMPPGVAADSARLAKPELNYYIQPVRIIAPADALIEIGGNGTFVEANSSRVTVGMTVGPVYRFKITNIPRNAGRELYPSIEILDKLNPPPGLEKDFPIQINISHSDLEHALDGRMVTKVIYLENPDTALPYQHVEDQQPYFDVSGRSDPLRAAERLGRPMAILRIGSRIPTNSAADAGFGFHSPLPALLDATPEAVNTDVWKN